jgi:hypothetical protein
VSPRRLAAAPALVLVLGLVLGLALASCGRRSPAAPAAALQLRTHASGAELLVPAGWELAIDGHRASAASPDGRERLAVQLYALPPDRLHRREPDRWECEEGTLVEPGPYYGTCTQEMGDVAITLSTTSRRPGLPRLREIAESVHGFTYQPPSDDRFADGDCPAALARMRRCVVQATMLERDREVLLERLHDRSLSCEDIARGHRESIRQLGCAPPPAPPAE